jgi:hypothetical protein
MLELTGKATPTTGKLKPRLCQRGSFLEIRNKSVNGIDIVNIDNLGDHLTASPSQSGPRTSPIL